MHQNLCYEWADTGNASMVRHLHISYIAEQCKEREGRFNNRLSLLWQFKILAVQIVIAGS
jgi:hypothetical protein